MTDHSDKIVFRIIAIALIAAAGVLSANKAVNGQVTAAVSSTQQQNVGPIRSTPAYAEVILRKTELEADLISYTDDYTESNPKVIDARYELAVLTKDLDRLYGVKPTEMSRLTEAVGKLIVKRAELAVDLNRLLRTYSEDHPQVKRAKRKVEVYDKALKEILG